MHITRLLRLLLLFGLMGWVLGVQASEASDKKQQLEQLRERMLKVEKKIASTQSLKIVEQKELRKVDKSLSESSRQLRQIKALLLLKQKNVQRLRKQSLALSKDIKQQKGFLAAQLKAAYLMGKQQRIKMLLNQQEPARVNRMLQYYGYLNQVRLDNVRVLDKKIADLAEVQLALGLELKEQASMVTVKQHQQASLQASKERQKTVVANLSKNLLSSASELTVLKENEKRLNHLLQNIYVAVNDIPINKQKNKPFIKQKGQLQWPVKGTLLKKFGSVKKSGRYDGVLIKANEGVEIKSISYGRVVYADWLRGYGLLIIIDHGANYLSLYAFNEGLYKDVGDWVAAGDVIASVGLSGGQKTPGLYFGIRKNGKPVNPTRWCRKVKNGRVG